jgi:chorismate mutase
MTREEALERLQKHRTQIDAVDVKILDLLNARTEIVREIGRVKQSAALPVYEPKREDEFFHNVTANNRGPLANDAVKRVFERIIDEMRTVQKERMRDQGSSGC